LSGFSYSIYFIIVANFISCCGHQLLNKMWTKYLCFSMYDDTKSFTLENCLFCCKFSNTVRVKSSWKCIWMLFIKYKWWMKYGTIQSFKALQSISDEWWNNWSFRPRLCIRQSVWYVGEDNIMYLVYHLFFTFTFISLVLQLTVTWDTSISKHIYLYKHYAFNIYLLELVFIQYIQPY